MISQIVLDPGVRIDDAWAARIADDFIASLHHSQSEINQMIVDAFLDIPLWDASERIVTRAADRIVKALGTSGLGYNLNYRKKGRWTLLLIMVFLRKSDSRIVIETVWIDGRAVEATARMRGRVMRHRTIRAPSVVDLLELSRHSFERFIQRGGLHRPFDITNIFRDGENLHVLSAVDVDGIGEVRLPLNTPKGRCALVVVRDEPGGPLVAKTLLAPPFTDRQEAELDALKARLAP